MKFNLEIVKKHPVATGAVIIVGGLFLFLMSRKGSAGGTVIQTAPANPQSDQNAFQLQYLGTQIQGQLDLTNAQGAISTTQQVNAITGQENLAGMQEEIERAKIQSGDYQATVAANSAIQLAQLETGANVAINAANIDLQKTIAGYSRDTSIALAGYQLQGIKEEASAFKFAQGGSDAANIIGTIGSVAAMFL